MSIMKNILFIIVLLAVAVIKATAKDFTPEQKALRLDIVKYLSTEGYKPQIDSDGDVWFEKNGDKYFVVISAIRSNPYLITLYQEFSYNNEDEGVYTRKNVERSIPIALKRKAVKLFCMDYSYTYRVDLFCKNVSIFKNSLYRLIDEMIRTRSDVKSFINLIPSDIDFSDKNAVFNKAMEYYRVDNFDKSFPIFKILSEEAYTKSYGYMGLAYEFGEGVPKDDDLMISYYEKAIENGYNWCAYRLGKYFYDKGDYQKAIANYERCGANENGFRSEALYQAGQMYEGGIGVQMNREKAIFYYRKSVQYSTELECSARLALMNLGEIVEKEEDFSDATKTMLMGMTAMEMYDAGLEYEQGLNKRYVSLPKAYAYFKAAADEDYTKAYAKMGEIYRSKYYPFNDMSMSDKFYKKALKAFKKKIDSDGDACYELGRIYQNGYGVNVDSEQAKYYYKLGALKGNANASYEFGLICKNNMEYPEAARFFQQATDKGLYRAMFELAKLYEKGYGVTFNREKAIELYTKCLESNSDIQSKARVALEVLGAEKEKY